MEYIIYLLIVIAICVGCKWSWKFRVRLKYRPRNRAKELGRMFEESDFSKIHNKQAPKARKISYEVHEFDGGKDD